MKTLFKFLLLVLFLSVNNKYLFSQRIVLSGGIYATMVNGIYLVVNNSNANAITSSGAGGYIFTKSENEIVKWNIGTATGAYTVPFGAYDTNAATWRKIPLTLNIGTAGTGSGSILFSTYGRSGNLSTDWNNLNYKPSDVTHMNNNSLTNNSAYVTDRFWIIDAQGYTTKPALNSIVFTYIDQENNNTGNTITEDNLQAQRFNPAPNKLWGDWGPSGTVNTSANTVTTGAVAASDFYRSWTLVDNTSPLPVTLLNFNAECEENKIKIKWETASEINNDRFEIEKSNDGKNYSLLDVVQGTGNSNYPVKYYTYDYEPDKDNYYLLNQIDYNGNKESYGPIYKTCNNENNSIDFNVFQENNNIFDIIIKTTNKKGNYTLKLIDSKGALVLTKDLKIYKGENFFKIKKPLNSGLYIISLENDKEKLIKKINVTR